MVILVRYFHCSLVLKFNSLSFGIFATLSFNEGIYIFLFIGRVLSLPDFNSFILFNVMVQYSFSLSIPMAFRLFFNAPITDEPTPMNGSKIQLSSFDNAK